jgi:hypothetical protein
MDKKFIVVFSAAIVLKWLIFFSGDLFLRLDTDEVRHLTLIENFISEEGISYIDGGAYQNYPPGFHLVVSASSIVSGLSPKAVMYLLSLLMQGVFSLLVYSACRKIGANPMLALVLFVLLFQVPRPLPRNMVYYILAPMIFMIYSTGVRGIRFFVASSALYCALVATHFALSSLTLIGVSAIVLIVRRDRRSAIGYVGSVFGFVLGLLMLVVPPSNIGISMSSYFSIFSLPSGFIDPIKQNPGPLVAAAVGCLLIPLLFLRGKNFRVPSLIRRIFWSFPAFIYSLSLIIFILSSIISFSLMTLAGSGFDIGVLVTNVVFDDMSRSILQNTFMLGRSIFNMADGVSMAGFWTNCSGGILLLCILMCFAASKIGKIDTRNSILFASAVVVSLLSFIVLFMPDSFGAAANRVIRVLSFPILLMSVALVESMFRKSKMNVWVLIAIISFLTLSSEVMVYIADPTYLSSINWITQNAEIGFSERISGRGLMKYEKLGYFVSVDFPKKTGFSGMAGLIFQENSFSFPLSLRIFDATLWNLMSIKKSSVEGVMERLHESYMEDSYSNVVYSNGLRKWNLQNSILIDSNNYTQLPDHFILEVEDFDGVGTSGWYEDYDNVWSVSFASSELLGSIVSESLMTIQGVYDVHVISNRYGGMDSITLCNNTTVLNSSEMPISRRNGWSESYLGRFYLGESCQIVIEHVQNGPEEYASRGSALDKLDFRWYSG